MAKVASPTRPKNKNPREGHVQLLTMDQVAERLGTSVHFPLRLIKERRIAYVKLGGGGRSPVRIREDVLTDFIADHTVEPS